MKTLLLTAAILIALFTAQTASAQWNDMLLNSGNKGKAELSTNKAATIKWDKTEYDFGNIKQDNPQKVEYVFENTGDKPVIITKAEASCGCTKLTYDQKPIMPGQKGTISTVFDAKELGLFQKSITVFMNLDAPNDVYELKLTGSVVK
ncbi:MAG: DUF1573 domain-containing protein [Bacteroidales bacterium]|nr:DUF1573 domain-containing protein [Bacteroidales bacterium]MBR4215761.1 DUF1573 domain-containing protein [Bacteroidales bacterium]